MPNLHIWTRWPTWWHNSSPSHSLFLRTSRTRASNHTFRTSIATRSRTPDHSWLAPWISSLFSSVSSQWDQRIWGMERFHSSRIPKVRSIYCTLKYGIRSGVGVAFIALYWLPQLLLKHLYYRQVRSNQTNVFRQLKRKHDWLAVSFIFVQMATNSIGNLIMASGTWLSPTLLGWNGLPI